MSKDVLRLSQIVGTFGPGAMVDLPDRSVMISGLDNWEMGGRGVFRVIEERRLVELLEQRLQGDPRIAQGKPLSLRTRRSIRACLVLVLVRVCPRQSSRPGSRATQWSLDRVPVAERTIRRATGPVGLVVGGSSSGQTSTRRSGGNIATTAVSRTRSLRCGSFAAASMGTFRTYRGVGWCMAT